MLIKAMLIWLCLLFGEFWKHFMFKYWSQGSGLHWVDVIQRYVKKKPTKNLLKSELCSKMKWPWGSRAVTWQEPGSMRGERCVSFLNTLIEPQQPHHLLSATFAFAADGHRQKRLPLLFLIETSIAPSCWRWKKGWWEHLVDLSWPMSRLRSPHLENCIESAKPSSMQRSKQASSNTWPSAVFWILFFLNGILLSLAGCWSCFDWCEHCWLSGAVVMK